MASVHMPGNGDMAGVRLVAFSNGDPDRAANWSTVRKKVAYFANVFSFSLSPEEKGSRPDHRTCARI